MEDENLELGKRFVEFRKRLGLDQRKMSLKLGISSSWLSNIEKGKVSTSKIEGKFLQDCLSAFGCSKDELLGETEAIDLQYHRLKQFSESLFTMVKNNKIPVFVVGDVCVDTIIDDKEQINESRSEILNDIILGGQGVSAARALASKEKYFPVLFGNVGNDLNGKKIIEKINKEGIISFILPLSGKETGESIIRFMGESRIVRYKPPLDDPNDFTSVQLRTVLKIAGVGEGWKVFFSPIVFHRYKEQKKKEYIETIMKILDLLNVPLVIKIPQQCEDLSIDEFNLITAKADMFYTELKTLKPFWKDQSKEPDEADIIKILQRTKGKTGQRITVLYGRGSNVSEMIKYERINENVIKELGVKNTKYEEKYNTLHFSDRIGYIEKHFLHEFFNETKKLPDDNEKNPNE